MSDEQLRLATAARRLRGRPGRPRKAADEEPRGSAVQRAFGDERSALSDADFGSAPRAVPGNVPAAGSAPFLLPRLLDLERAAAYLGVSTWTIRDLEAAGELRRIRVPLGQKELRRLLFDRLELDQLVERWKS